MAAAGFIRIVTQSRFPGDPTPICAAVTIEHSCTRVTRDEDFERFVKHGFRLEIWCSD
ncbi:MAG: hypothetical protein KAJ98_09070 [Spirochaetaceae bacterium]|nr:hypothetical protein [Spirochaetaceae bacterium]